jgi:hypothetical protein
MAQDLVVARILKIRIYLLNNNSVKKTYDYSHDKIPSGKTQANYLVKQLWKTVEIAV